MSLPTDIPDPRRWLASRAMTPMQVWIVALSVGLIAIDGYDVLAISFASPGIAREWGIDRAQLGVVLSMELLGMGFGSVVLGGAADRFGRRPAVLCCLGVMTLGMAMVSLVNSLVALCLWRVVTGLGIGGMVAAGNAIATEFSNDRRRDLSVAMMAIGYPLGAVAGGLLAALVLRSGDWRVVFVCGAGLTAAFLPAVFFGLPESVAWLLERRPPGALEKVNRTLHRLGYASVERLPVPLSPASAVPLFAIFKPSRLATTVLLTSIYFLQITSFYFIIKWVPKIVVDMGYAPAEAAGVLVWANVGGASGGAVLGLLSARFGIKRLTMLLLLGSTVLVSWFGRGQTSLAGLSLVCAAAGFCTNGGVVGIFGVLARAFPTDVRATGTGFAVGVGRGASVLAPIIAGMLFQAGHGLATVSMLMSVGSAVGAVLLSRVALTGATRD